jgi:phosphate:Na+ symporter
MNIAAKNTLLEDRVDELSREFQNRHIERLDNDKCNVESGVVFIDVVNHLERIADHIYKITLLSTDGLQGYEKSLLPVTE